MFTWKNHYLILVTFLLASAQPVLAEVQYDTLAGPLPSLIKTKDNGSIQPVSEKDQYDTSAEPLPSLTKTKDNDSTQPVSEKDQYDTSAEPLPSLIKIKDTVSIQPVSGKFKYDTLAGPLPALIKSRNNPYIVITDIEVPANKVVTIEPGVIILFQNFTGLHVRGKLIANGTKKAPVVFTSEFDKTYNPSTTFIANPFDWNGIYIHSDGFGTYLEHCIISYTVYGLMSETKYIRLDPVTFEENGKSDLQIEKEIKKDVIPKTPYHYVLSTKDVTKEGVDIKIIKDPLAPKRNFFRYSGVVLGLGGVVAGIAHAVQYAETKDIWVEFNQKQPSTNTKFNQSSVDYENARDNYIEKKRFVITDFVIAAIGIFGFTWSFTF